MRAVALASLVGRNMRAQWRHLLMASIGIVLGVGSLFVFISVGHNLVSILASGMSIHPERVEVVPKPVDLRLGLFRLGVGGEAIGIEALDGMAGFDGVLKVYPKARLTVPSTVTGGAGWVGSDISVEIVAEGVPPDLVGEDVEENYSFTVFPDPSVGNRGTPCSADNHCSSNEYCSFSGSGSGKCRAYVPVLASPGLVDLYNRFLSKTHGLPKLDPDLLIGTVVDLRIGDSILNRRVSRISHTEKARLVGFSDVTSSLALAMPLQFVLSSNAISRGSVGMKEFHSAILEISPGTDVDAFQPWLEERDLELRERSVERISRYVRVATGVASSASAAVLVVATLHIMHVFMLLVTQRKRQLATMRAMGATRGDLTALMIVEAGVVGFGSGLVATAAGTFLLKSIEARIGGALQQMVMTSEVVPLAPEPWVVLVCAGLSVVCCTFGAGLAVIRVVLRDPVSLLRG